MNLKDYITLLLYRIRCHPEIKKISDVNATIRKAIELLESGRNMEDLIGTHDRMDPLK